MLSYTKPIRYRKSQRVTYARSVTASYPSDTVRLSRSAGIHTHRAVVLFTTLVLCDLASAGAPARIAALPAVQRGELLVPPERRLRATSNALARLPVQLCCFAGRGHLTHKGAHHASRERDAFLCLHRGGALYVGPRPGAALSTGNGVNGTRSSAEYLRSRASYCSMTRACR